MLKHAEGWKWIEQDRVIYFKMRENNVLNVLKRNKKPPQWFYCESKNTSSINKTQSKEHLSSP